MISPAAASQLVIATQPSATATAGVAFGTQPVVYVEDQYGNLETGDNTTQVTAASLPIGSGPLQGTTTVTARVASRRSPIWRTTRPRRSRSSSRALRC